MNAAEHCLQLVRDGDKDRFLSALFAPDGKRPHLLALYAFNLELARVSKAVSEPHIGLIRLQWWHDTIDGIAEGHPVDHPVASALAEAIAAASLPLEALHGLISARECEFQPEPFTNLGALEAYLGGTASALIQLAALVLAGPSASRMAEAAGFGGVAYGLSQLLCDQTLSGRFLPPGLDAAGHALQRLAEAREAAGTMPAEALPAILYVTLTPLYLRKPRPSQFGRQLALWWEARRNRF